MRSLKSHAHEIRKWIKWRWDARPKIRLKGALKKRWENMREWFLSHWYGRQVRTKGKPLKQKLKDAWKWIKFRWEDRPRFSIRAMKKGLNARRDKFVDWRLSHKYAKEVETPRSAMKGTGEKLQEMVDTLRYSKEVETKRKDFKTRVKDGRDWVGNQWHVRPWAVVLVAMMMLSATALAVFNKQARQVVQEWRAETATRKAREAAAAGDWEAAGREARRSLRGANAQNARIDSLRILWKASREQDDLFALAYATFLFQHAEATLEDRTEVLAYILDEGDILAANALLRTRTEVALGKDIQDLEFRYQMVRYSLAAAQLEQAAGLCEGDEIEERRADFDLLMARGLAARGEDELRGEVTFRIGRTLKRPDREDALKAMRALITLPNAWIPPELATKVVERFGEDRELEAADRLRLTFFRLVLDRSEKEKVVDAMVEEYRRNEFAALAQWLMRVGELERVISLTEPDESPDGLPRGVFVHRMNALIAKRRYETLESELQGAPEEIPRYELLAYQAAVSARLGKEAEEAAFWEQAFLAAQFDPIRNHYYRLAKIAKDMGSEERRMEALTRAVEHRAGVPPTAETLKPVFAWLYKSGNTKRLLYISYRLLQREPANPLLINNYQYLRALHDEPDLRGVEVMQRVVERYPERRSFRSTLALTLLLTGAAEEAIAQLQHIGSDPTEFTAGDKAVYAGALSAVGRSEEADAVRAGIDWSAFPEAEAKALRALSQPPGDADPSPKDDSPKRLEKDNSVEGQDDET